MAVACGSTSQSGAMPIRLVSPSYRGRFQSIEVNGTAYPTRRRQIFKSADGRQERWLLETVKPAGVTGAIQLVDYNSSESIGAAPNIPVSALEFQVTVGGVIYKAVIGAPGFTVQWSDEYGYEYSGGETLKDPDGTELYGAIRWFLRSHNGCTAWELDVIWTNGVIAKPTPHCRFTKCVLKGAYVTNTTWDSPAGFNTTATVETVPSKSSDELTLQTGTRTLEQFGRHEWRLIVTEASPSDPSATTASVNAMKSREGYPIIRGSAEPAGWHKNPYITKCPLPELKKTGGRTFRDLPTDYTAETTEIASERAASPAGTWRIAHRNTGKGGGGTGGEYLEWHSFAEALISVTQGDEDHEELCKLLQVRQWRQSCRRQGLIYDTFGRPLDVGAYVAEFGAVEWFLNPSTSEDTPFSTSDKRDWDAVEPQGTSPTGTASAGEVYQLSWATVDNQHAPRALHESIALCELWADDVARHYLGGRAASCRLESFEQAANPSSPSQFREKLAWEVKQAQDDPGTGIGFNRDEGWRMHTIAQAVKHRAASASQYQQWAEVSLDGVVVGQTSHGHIGVTNTGKAAEDVSGSGASAPYRYASRPWNSGFIILGLFELLDAGAIPISRSAQVVTAMRGVADQHRWAWLTLQDSPSFSIAVADTSKNFYATINDVPNDGFQANPLYSTNPADYEGEGYYTPNFYGNAAMFLLAYGTLADLEKILEGYLDWKDNDSEHETFANDDFSGALTQEFGMQTAMMYIAQKFPRSRLEEFRAIAAIQNA